ncbi:helix-turn-helix domain-containing protein [Pedobacter alpinus]|uniref:Helix-turn-helix domain-containing protein n=1 Tax=Pedobacter alpinus TaxID=1590643 RepID=A0ABW5TRK3_9SPHI
MTIYGKLLTQEEIIQVAYPVITTDFEGLTESAGLPFKDYVVKNFRIDDKIASDIELSVSENVVLMQFCVDGTFTFKNSDSKKTFSFGNGQCNIIYLPKGNYGITSFLSEINLISVYLSQDFFFRQIQQVNPAFMIKSTNLFQALFSKNISITHRLKNILNEIVNCEFDGHLKILYLKAKVIELLILQLAQHEEEKTISLKPEDIEKMTIIKDLIETNFNEVYSLSYLAKVAGTNEQYLKKHFKILFGNTVFGYMLACKMEKAKEMLSTGKHQITEVSEIVGYKHATHFTTAFKKFFGYLPSLVKRSL